jgi:hypothetical protein
MQATGTRTFEEALQRIEALNQERSKVYDEVTQGYQAAIAAEQRRRQPRATKRYRALDPETLAQIARPFQDRWTSETALIAAENHRIHAELADLAAEVVFRPDPDAMHVVGRSDSYSYHTQGYGAITYARHEHAPTIAKLQELGFTTHLAFHRRKSSDRWGTEHGTFVLWVDCPPWMATAARWLITVEEAARARVRAGANPHVYAGFAGHLDYDMVDRLYAERLQGHRAPTAAPATAAAAPEPGRAA